MNRTVKIMLIVGAVFVVGLVLLGLVAVAVYLPLRSSRPVPVEQVTVPATSGDIRLLNPAAAYREEQGYCQGRKPSSAGKMRGRM
jgi:hypothetical protein